MHTDVGSVTGTLHRGHVLGIMVPMTPDPLRVLVVCTGNVCRSPAVERMLAAGERHTLPVHTTSTRRGSGVTGQ